MSAHHEQRLVGVGRRALEVAAARITDFTARMPKS